MEIGLMLDFLPYIADSGAADAGDWRPGSVIGFSFVIEQLGGAGSALPELRFKTQPTGDLLVPYCAVFPRPIAGQAIDVRFEDLRFACYDTSAAGGPPTPPFEQIGWQFLAIPGEDIPYNLCIIDIRPILAN